MKSFKNMFNISKDINEENINEESINSQRAKMWKKACSDIKSQEETTFSAGNVSIKDTKYWCSIEDHENDKGYIFQTLSWDPSGIYTLEVVAPPYKIKGIVAKFEFFEDALELVIKNLNFVKYNGTWGKKLTSGLAK